MPSNASRSDARLMAEALEAAWNAHDAERIAALYADDCEAEDVALARPVRGRATIRRLAELHLAAFPDLHVRMERVLEQDGAVALLWETTGTHQAPFMHIPATGRRVHIRGMTLLDLEAGKIRRSTRVWDLAGLLRALGLLPQLQDAAAISGSR